MTSFVVSLTLVAAAGVALACVVDHVRGERSRNERARAALTPQGTVRAKRPTHHLWTYWP